MDVATIAQAAMMMQNAMTGQELTMLMLKQSAVQEQTALALVTQAQSLPAPSAPHLGTVVDIVA